MHEKIVLTYDEQIKSLNCTYIFYIFLVICLYHCFIFEGVA